MAGKQTPTKTWARTRGPNKAKIMRREGNRVRTLQTQTGRKILLQRRTKTIGRQIQTEDLQITNLYTGVRYIELFFTFDHCYISAIG